MACDQMIRFCAYVIVAIGAFSVNEAIAQTVGVTLREKDAGQTTSPNTEQLPAAPKDAGARQPPPGGNPLWGIPISALDATRERPVFSASRRPPMPPVVAERVVAPPPPPKPSRPRAAASHARRNGDRPAQKCRARSRPHHKISRSSPCRRRRLGV